MARILLVMKTKNPPSEVAQLRTRKATLTAHLGPDHPDTIRAGRELWAAKVHAIHEAARAGGLDDTDLIAVMRTGGLPAEVTA